MKMLKRTLRALPAALLLASLAAPILASAAPAGGTPHTRLQNERTRLQNGLKNGSLNQRQYNRGIARVDQIRDQMRNDRQQNGGHLTQQERARTYQQENRESEKIYDMRHGIGGKPPV